MSLPLADEVLHSPRRQSLILLIVGTVFISIGLWILPKLGKADQIFAWLWGSIWFLGSGAGFIKGFLSLLKPPIYAVLSADGLALPDLRVSHIPWSHVLDVRLGPKTITDREGTHYLFKEPIILRLRDSTPFKSKSAVRFTRGMTAVLTDGTVELMIQTLSCPLPANVLLARIQSRLNGKTVPALPVRYDPAATFGGKPLNPTIGRSKLTVAFAGLFAVFGFFFAVLSARILVQARNSLLWPETSGIVESSHIEKDSEHGSSFIIRYSYSVDGRSYTGRRLAFFTVSSDHGKYLHQYSRGAQVTVYYQPDRPENAVILREASSGWFLVGFGLIFAGVGIAILRSHLRPRRASVGSEH